MPEQDTAQSADELAAIRAETLALMDQSYRHNRLAHSDVMWLCRQVLVLAAQCETLAAQAANR